VIARVRFGRRSILRLGGSDSLWLSATAPLGAACASPRAASRAVPDDTDSSSAPTPGAASNPIAMGESVPLGSPPSIARPDPPRVAATLPAASTEEASAPWAREWLDLILAVRREGRLSLFTWVGGGYRQTVQAFQRAFPGIAVEHVEDSSADSWLARVGRERCGGAYVWDIGMLHTDRALQEGAPQGMWAPLRPLLFHPDAIREGA